LDVLTVTEGSGTFVQKAFVKLFAVCLQYSGNDEEARDILQEGFIKIFENLHHYKHEGLLKVG